MNKQEVMKELTKNAKYDYAWITEVADLISKSYSSFIMDDHINIGILENLPTGKLKVMNEHSISDNFWIDHIDIVNKLNATQLMIYAIGVEKEIDNDILEKFTNPDIPYAKSNYIINAIIEDNNTTLTDDKYLSDQYDAEQIYELYAGIKDKVDISKFDYPELSADQMRLARTALAIGASVNIGDVVNGDGSKSRALVIVSTK